MNKLANSKKILKATEKIANAIQLEAEEILEHAEEVVKKFVPARKVATTLSKLEKKLEAEGVEALFDKRTTREALRKTAKEEVSEEEIDELVEEIIKAIIEELEEVLEDADDVADELVKSFEKDEDLHEMEARIKASLEKKMNNAGIYCKFARRIKTSKVSKKEAAKAKTKRTLLEKIRASK